MSEAAAEPLADDVVERVVAIVRRQWPTPPDAAIILGTGLGHLAAQMAHEAVIDYDRLPGFPRSTATGHRGRFVCGQLAGRPVIAMDGRFHFYEGYSVQQVTLPVRVMQRLGANLLIVSNASGGLNPQFRSGDIMAVAGHIDLMGARTATLAASVRSDPTRGLSGGQRRAHPPATLPDELIAARSCPSPVYDPALLELAQSLGRQHGFACPPGVYVSVLGPNYETRAEYRFLRRIGGDAVGMSTVPEVLLAARRGMRVLALSTITNVARPDAPARVDAQEVIDIASTAEPRLRELICGVIEAGVGKREAGSQNRAADNLP